MNSASKGCDTAYTPGACSDGGLGGNPNHWILLDAPLFMAREEPTIQRVCGSGLLLCDVLLGDGGHEGLSSQR